MKIAGACSLFAVIMFIFTASQTADAKELIATTYTSSLAGLGASYLDWDGVLPSFDELLDVMGDPQAALSSVVERIANLSSYAELDPAYFFDGVQALQAINLVLSFVKLLATYGRKLFALVDAAKSILKTHTGYEAASGGDDGTVQVYETMTDLSAMKILDFLNSFSKLSFATLVLQDEEALNFESCSLADDNLAGLLALVTHPEMIVKSRSLCLAGNNLVTAQAWKKVLPNMLIKTNLTHLKCASHPRFDVALTLPNTSRLPVRACSLQDNSLGHQGGAALAEGLKGNSTLQSLEYAACDSNRFPSVRLSINAR